MKANITKIVFVDLILDSSETIMFTKGGKHKLNICPKDLFKDLEDLQNCKLEISIQLERNEQGRFDFITNEAKKSQGIV